MPADRTDLEPLLDDDYEPEPRDEPRGEWPSALVLLALALTIVAGVLAAALGQYVRDQERASARARIEAESAQAAAERSESRLRAGVIAEAERERARVREAEAERFDATASQFVLREPIVVLPATVRLCRAGDLEVFPHGLPGAIGLALANRSGRPCGLPDYPILQGLDEGGRWRTVPVQQSPASSYTDGPEWTGLLVPGRVAFLAVRQPPPLRNGTCLTGTASPTDFSGLRYVLAPQSEPLVVPDRTWSVGPCRPEMHLWAYDHVGG